jgi:hypothetical protein
MTTPFERRVAAIEKQLLRDAHAGPIDPRWFVLLTLFGFYSDCCDRRDAEHPLEACSRLLRRLDPGNETVVPALIREFFAAHGIDDPDHETESAVSAMQRLLDGVPVEWRDADVAWWPECAAEMWRALEPSAHGSRQFSAILDASRSRSRPGRGIISARRRFAADAAAIDWPQRLGASGRP